jgi:hypothetical protein
MPSKTFYPRLVLKRKGGCGVFAQIAALAHLNPTMSTGELEHALEAADFAKECDQAILDKGDCPIHLDKIHCPNCHFNSTGHKCEWNEIKETRHHADNKSL